MCLTTQPPGTFMTSVVSMNDHFSSRHSVFSIVIHSGFIVVSFELSARLRSDPCALVRAAHGLLRRVHRAVQLVTVFEDELRGVPSSLTVFFGLRFHVGLRQSSGGWAYFHGGGLGVYHGRHAWDIHYLIAAMNTCLKDFYFLDLLFERDYLALSNVAL
jgi:hypothetical protein